MKFLDNHGEKILYITWGILFFICLIAGCDVRVHAASGSSTVIPYNIAEHTSINSAMMDHLDEALTAYYNFFNYDPDDPVLVFTYDGYNSVNNGWQYVFIKEPYMINDVVHDFDYTTSRIWLYSHYDIKTVTIYSVGSPGYGYNNGTSTQIFGPYGSADTSVGIFTPLYPFYYNGDPIFSSNGNEVIVNRSISAGPVLGHAEAPNLNNDNVDPNELPDISSHQPTIPSPPTVDTSSPSTLLNSIFELLKWGFNALISSINCFMSYIGDLFSYLFQLLINNIKNAIDNIYQNFANLFEPVLNSLSSLTQNISDKVDYITAPLDPATISSGIESTDLVTDVTGYKTALNTFVGSFNNVSEPSTYKISIHFENISMFSDVGVQYIDLGWLNSVKTLIRGFVACLVTYGVIISIFDSVPNYINGGGGEDD